MAGMLSEVAGRMIEVVSSAEGVDLLHTAVYGEAAIARFERQIQAEDQRQTVR
jgi:hypothetical protein